MAGDAGEVVSFLIPFHNAAPWLARSVSSALAECGPDDEVVVVDDGSNDDGAALLPEDPRVRLISSEHRGICGALNLGLEACRGTLIARLDADDLAVPGRIAAQRALLARHPEVVAVGGQARLVNEGAEDNRGMRLYVQWVNAQRDPHRELLAESPLFHPAVTFRAEAVRAVGGYRHGPFPEDYDLWCRLVQAGGRLANVEREVLEIRDHGGRLTRRDDRYSREGFDRVRRDLLDHMLGEGPARLLIVGAGKGGRRWLRWAAERGHEVTGVVDIKPGGTRGPHRVEAIEIVKSRPFDLLLVAIGSRGGRAAVRADLQRLRPDLVEGRDWYALL